MGEKIVVVVVGYPEWNRDNKNIPGRSIPRTGFLHLERTASYVRTLALISDSELWTLVWFQEKKDGTPEVPPEFSTVELVKYEAFGDLSRKGLRLSGWRGHKDRLGVLAGVYFPFSKNQNNHILHGITDCVSYSGHRAWYIYFSKTLHTH